MSEEKKRPGVGFGVMIFKDGKILLGQRHSDATKADSELHGEGTWTMPGGKLHWGESLEDGARREAMEETGITLNEVEVICFANDMNEHAHFVTAGLMAKGFSGEPQVMEPDEIIKWQWFSLDQLPRPLFFPSERIIKNYHAKKFYQIF